MDTKKFEYLETIRETIEMGDFEELDDYVDDIRDHVRGDQQFQELFSEIKSKNYGDVVSLIDEFIYQDIRSEADNFLNEEALQKMSELDSGLETAYKTETEIPEEITFEEYNDDSYLTEMAADDE